MLTSETETRQTGGWRSRFRKMTGAAVVAAVLAATVGVVPAAAAAAADPEVEISSTSTRTFNLTSRLAIGEALALDVSGARLTGTWNSRTGAFTNGSLTLPPQSLDVEAEGIGTITANVSFTPDPVRGNIPANGSRGTLRTAVAMSITLQVPILGQVTCSLPKLNLTLATKLIGTNQVVAIDQGVSVGEVDCGALSPVANGQLGLPVNNAYLCFASRVNQCTTTPGQPRSPKAAPANRQVTVTWAAPAAKSGGTPTGYRVQRAIGNGKWTAAGRTAGNVRKLVVRNLKNGTNYRFRVVAESGPLDGRFSAAVSATPRTKATAPRKVAARPGKGQVRVSWLAPSNNGGSAVTRYRVQRSANGRTWTPVATVPGKARSAVVKGMRSGSTFRFRVVAINAAGVGAPSQAVTARVR